MQKSTQQALIIVVFILSGLLGLGLSVYQHNKNSTPAPTITRTFHSPVTFVKQLAGDKDAGRKIFLEFCSACHGKEPKIDIPAPRIGDKQIWKALAHIGMPGLLKMTIRGKGAMPARGGCFECSDGQLREAIQYILDQS